MTTDNRVDIDIELTDEEFNVIARKAHERDITFNQMVAIILQAEIDRREQADD